MRNVPADVAESLQRGQLAADEGVDVEVDLVPHVLRGETRHENDLRHRFLQPLLITASDELAAFLKGASARCR
jgi:hypothetical protein